MAPNCISLVDARKGIILHLHHLHELSSAESVDSHPERLGTVALRYMGHPEAKVERPLRARLHECILRLLNPVKYQSSTTENLN